MTDKQDWRMLRPGDSPTDMTVRHYHDDGRMCRFSNRLGVWVFEGHKQCLRSHGAPSKGWVRAQGQVLPYPEPGGGATQGHSGSETSRERAVEDVSTGTAVERQRWLLQRLGTLGAHGITVAELRAQSNWHHGQASSVLSVLHKEGRIARLTETRARCKVYVRADFVEGRDIEGHGRRQSGNQEALAWEAYKAGWMRANHRTTRPGPMTTEMLRESFNQWRAEQ
jgi:hypothetical protein